MYAGNSELKSPTWVSIGNNELIRRRASREVPTLPGGMLNDYVPFYFTPFSPMLYNIHTGRGDVARVSNADIVILVSSVHRIIDLGLPYVFTDRHAYTVTAKYYNEPVSLKEVDWNLIQNRNFRRDENDPEKVERYQAEALIHQHVPVEALLGAVCHNEQVMKELQEQSVKLGTKFDIRCLPQWYF